MADREMNSIKFPGLPDRYKFLRLDPTLTQSGKAADAKEVGDRLASMDDVLFSVSTVVLSWNMEQGTVDGNAKYSSNVRIRTKNAIAVSTGDIIQVKPNGLYIFVTEYANAQSTAPIYESGWRNEDFTYTFTSDGIIWVVAATGATYATSEAIVPSDFVSYVVVNKDTLYINELEQDLVDTTTAKLSWIDGYIADNGVITPDNTYTSNSSNIVAVNKDTNIKYSIAYTETKQAWFAYATYDANGKFIERVVVINGSAKVRSGEITVGDAVHYIRFSVRMWENVHPTIRIAYSQYWSTEVELVANISNNVIYNLYDINSVSGYVNSNGMIDPTDSRIEYATDFISVSEGDIFYHFSKVLDTPWMSYGTYDSSKGFIVRNTALSDSVVIDGEYYAYQKITIPSGVSYIRASTRTDDLKDYFLLKVGDRGVTNAFIDYLLTPFGGENNLKAYQISKGANLIAINHRGYNSVAPENTLPAFRLSREKGFAYVECDVAFTSDDVPVVLHDATINRTARNADGTAIANTVNIADITYEQALSYDFGIWKSADYAGTKIPTFEQFIKLCSNLGLVPVVEIKVDNVPTQAQIEGLVDICRKYRLDKSVLWQSFGLTPLTYVKGYDQSAAVGVISSSATSAVIDEAVTLKTGSNKVFINIDKNAVTDTFVGLCKTADLDLYLWVVDDATIIKSANPYVRGMSSDRLNASVVVYDDAMG